MLELIDTVIEVAAVLFALLGAFIMHYLLTRNETIMEHMGTDYHHLRAALHLFNYKPLYRNSEESKKILGPILDYLAYVCQFWYIPAVQGSHLRINVLKAPRRVFTYEGEYKEQLRQHFLDTAKKFDESRGTVRALPKGLFEFGLLLLLVLAGITLSGVWIKLVYGPYILTSSFDCLFFGFYAALAFFFVLFFAFIYDIKRLDAFFVKPHVYDLLKWQFIRCLIFASMDKDDNKSGDYKKEVSEYLKKAKIAYDDYTNLGYIKSKTREESLEKAEGVAKQFLEKRRNMDKDWEKEVEWTVPRAATEVLRRRYWKTYVAFIMAFSALLICLGVLPCFRFLLLGLFVILAILVVLVILFLIFFGEMEPIPGWMLRGRKITPFLKNLYNCWDRIVEQHEPVKGQVKTDNRTKHEKICKEVEKEIKKCKDV
jgi:ABC-type multidrug transport system fused ATPase/permease subunit